MKIKDPVFRLNYFNSIITALAFFYHYQKIPPILQDINEVLKYFSSALELTFDNKLNCTTEALFVAFQCMIHYFCLLQHVRLHEPDI